MKPLSFFLLVFLVASCASGKQRSYTGSTPAAPAVRFFLGIPFSDSIDFIRWKIIISDDKYSLKCQYGISKPNTNGFMNDGKKVELNGEVKKEKSYYYLRNGNKTLKVLEINEDLLHLLNDNNSLLTGNGGWNYTLNNDMPLHSDKVNLTPEQKTLKDSTAFQGKTPCFQFGRIRGNTTCYKLKWFFVLYAKDNKPTTYLMNATVFSHVKKAGVWSIITGKDGRTVYKLDADNNESLYLLKLDENTLVFTDEQGKLMVGNEDFSYTLSIEW